MSEVKINRAELIELKEKLKIAQKGYHLLSKKRDGLIMEFFKVLQDVKETRDLLNQQLKKALELLEEIKRERGLFYIKTLSLILKDKPVVNVNIKNIMGVKVPQIEINEIKNSERLEKMTILDLKTILLIRNFEKLLKLTMQTLEIEITLKKLLQEIESTKKRVNALEKIHIPKIKEDIKFIKLALEEQERENILKLKKIKAKKEKETKN
ncbi:MAG: V-type ATP synthase subunit D [Nanoarchaeota archaeon]